MFIKPKDPDDRLRIRAEILAWLETSRFTATLELMHHYRWKYVIKIDNVRLRNRKSYCGQHPNECQVNPFFTKKHRTGRWLEGADWIGFNDGLNDLLDRLGLDADVWSHNREAKEGGRYFLRQGKCRRTDYDSIYIARDFGVGGYLWTREGQFENFIGKEAPRSWYPEGTPGLADWRLEAEDPKDDDEISQEGDERATATDRVAESDGAGDPDGDGRQSAPGRYDGAAAPAEPAASGEAADLEPFLLDLFKDRTVLSLGELLEAYFSDQPVPFAPVPEPGENID